MIAVGTTIPVGAEARFGLNCVGAPGGIHGT